LRVRASEDRPAAPAVSKFAAIEDWNSTEWLEQLRLCDEAADSANFLRRHRSTWEIGQLLYAAALVAPPERTSRLRFVLPAQNSLAVYAARRYPVVEILAAGGTQRVPAEGLWPHPGLPHPPASVVMLPGAADDPMAEGTADLVIVPQNAVLASGLAGFAMMLERLDAMLPVGGTLLFAAEVVIAGPAATDRLPAQLAADGALQQLIADCTGWTSVGDSDWSLGEATIDRLALAGTPSESEPHFVIKIGELWSTTAVWGWRKAAATSAEGWEQLGERLSPFLAPGTSAARPRSWLGRGARRQLRVMLGG
jgi:hypothetical protein